MSIRPITDTLRQIGSGAFLDTVSTQFNDLVLTIDAHGGKGELTLKLVVKKATRGGAMLVTGVSALKKPAEDPAEAMLFATPEGNLVADDPRQHKLDLKRVDGASDTPPASLKTA